VSFAKGHPAIDEAGFLVGTRARGGVGTLPAYGWVYSVQMPDPVSELVVVDDDDSVREAVLLVLRRAWSGGAVGFRDGQAGLEHALRNPVAAVILDIEMLPVSGVDIARALRRERPEVPIIFLSGNPEALEGVPGLRPEAVLRKPVSADALVRAVMAHGSGNSTPSRRRD